MDILNSRYYKITKNLMKLIGQWRYQDSRSKKVRFCICALIFFSFFFTQVSVESVEKNSKVARIITSRADFHVVIEIAPFFIVGMSCTMKFLNSHLKCQKLGVLVEQIVYDWKVKRAKEESSILYHYAEEGRFLTAVYALNMYSISSLYCLLSLISPFLDVVMPLNESRTRILPFEAEYFLDKAEYFYPVLIHMYVVTLLCITTIVATDSMFLGYVEHACALFAVVGHRLENAIDCLMYYSEKYSCAKDIWYQSLVRCMKEHKKALEFTNVIECCYTTSYFVQVGFSMLCMSITLLHIVYLVKTTEAIVFIGFFFGQMFHLYCICYAGQKIKNHSGDIFEKAYSANWYNSSVNAQRLILLILKRSQTPCLLTGGIFTLSLETFSTILQTSMSYFTVLSTTQ